MFDLSSFELQKSIMNHNRKVMMEAELAATKAHRRFLESSIDALASEYDRTYNTEASRSIERKFLREGAVISVVKDAMYGIFESALLLDESAKAEYQENIKTLFETYFYQVLKENDITTLGKFKEFTKNSNIIIENVIERAENLVSMNEGVYTALLENEFNSTSLDSVIIDALQVIGESVHDHHHVHSAVTPITEEEKVNKARAVVDQLTSEFQRFTLEQKVASAHKIIQAAIIVLRCGVAVDKSIYTVIDKLLSVVNGVFGKESTDTLRDKLLRKTLAEVDSYYYVAIDVAITLKKLQKNYPVDSKEYLKVGERIVSIYKAIVVINQYRQSLIEKQQTKQLHEMSFVEFLTEADATSNTSVNHEDIITGLKQKISTSMIDLDAYQGLENLKLANRITGDSNYHNEFIKHGNSGSNITLLIIKALKLPNLPDKVKDQYVKEGRAYRSNLSSVVETGRRHGYEVTNMIKQGVRLESFLNQVDLNRGGKKMIRESISPLLSLDHKVGMDMLANTVFEAAQFFELYEASASDIAHIVNIVNESDDSSLDVKQDLPVMIRTMRESVEDTASPEIHGQLACLEAAVYKKLYMANPNGISEAASAELKQGKYPKLNDFLDDDEKKLIDSIASATGKDKVVEVVKSKIIGVIEAEETRMEKLEADEQKLLSKLSKKIPEGGEAIQEAVQSHKGAVTGPASLFEAIVMSRSKKYIQEATHLGTGFDINSQKETIMAETVTLYTIHETFNTMKFGDYDQSKINKLTQDYYRNKI
jgi:hypothetical protein